MKFKKYSIICYILAIVALIVGAAFHNFRMNPEDLDRYTIGVTMGISMASLAGAFLISGFACTFFYRRRMRELKNNK